MLLGIEEDDVRTATFLFDHAREVPLKNWQGIKEPDRLLLGLIGHLKSYPWIAATAAMALDYYPEPERCVSEIEAVLPGLGARQRRIAGWTVIEMEANQLRRAEEWKGSEDPVLREVAGETVAILWKRGLRSREDLVSAALADPDDAVRHAIVAQLKGAELTPRLQRDVREAEQRKLSGWTCPNCDAQNPPAAPECSNCSSHAPHIPIVIDSSHSSSSTDK